MAASEPRWLAYARLLRLPNLFTAIADPLAGWFVAGCVGGASGQLPLIVAASACLYSAGIVMNDCFDYLADSRQRPERPLPRGAIRLRTAWSLGVTLLVMGAVLGLLAGRPVAVVLAGLILLYDTVAKKSAWLGPLNLGACRALNFALGAGSFTPLMPPVILGSYVATLAAVARREETQPPLRRLVTRLLLGIIVVDAALVWALTGDWQPVALVLSLLVPAAVLGRILSMT